MTPDIRIAVPGGFLVEQEHMPGWVLVLRGPWRPELADLMKETGVHFLRLSQSMGWQPEDLSFLESVPGLRGIEVYHMGVKDLSALHRLPQLEFIKLQCLGELDFSCFPSLQVAGVRWLPGCETLFECENLRFLSVDTGPIEDLQPFAKLKKLERLQLFTRKLITLRGAEKLPRLRHVRFADCTSLSDISALASVRTLEVFDADTCKKVNSLTPFAGLPRLQKLWLDNCRYVASVKPLEACPALEEVCLVATVVLDGDLNPLLRLRSLSRVALAQHPTHSHTAAQINQELADR